MTVPSTIYIKRRCSDQWFTPLIGDLISEIEPPLIRLYLLNSKFPWIFVDIGSSPDPWWIKTSNQEIWATRCYQFCIDLLYHGSIAKDFTEAGEFTIFMVDCTNLVTFPNSPKTRFFQEIYTTHSSWTCSCFCHIDFCCCLSSNLFVWNVLFQVRKKNFKSFRSYKLREQASVAVHK